jgi:imidazole glycerol-phosphate synthase subunit HisF
MLMKRIVPCLDVRHGRTVKGVQFDDLVDVGDPVELACRYADHGADEIVLLDVTATLEGRSAFLDVVSNVAAVLSIPFTVGGGVRAASDVERLLQAGADKVSINSAALASPELIRTCADAFGEQCIVVAIDSRRTVDGHRVHTHGGQRVTPRDTRAWAREAADRGAGELLITSMDRDGTASGYDIALLSEIIADVSVGVVASGGAGTAEHVCDVLRNGAAAALLAGILHRNETDIPSIKRTAFGQGISIRV